MNKVYYSVSYDSIWIAKETPKGVFVYGYAGNSPYSFFASYRAKDFGLGKIILLGAL